MFEMLESKRVSSPGLALHIGLFVLGAVASGKLRTPWPFIAGGVIGLYFLFSIKVVRQWEKVAVLRFGKFRHLQGPGIFWIIPVVDTLSAYVDHHRAKLLDRLIENGTADDPTFRPSMIEVEQEFTAWLEPHAVFGRRHFSCPPRSGA